MTSHPRPDGPDSASADQNSAPSAPLEGSYPLSPMQGGMLFSSLLSPSDGYDIEQVTLTLNEDLRTDVLATAWTLVVRAHSSLTCTFVWNDDRAPYQTPHPDVVVPLDVRKLSATDAASVDREVDAFLRVDRELGFDLRKAPLMRVTLFRGAEHVERLVWTFHHILMDVESISTVLAAVFDLYRDLIADSGSTIQADRPAGEYRTYVRWLMGKDLGDGIAFFKELLAGSTPPTSLPAREDHDAHGGTRFASLSRDLSSQLTLSIEALAERTATSNATILQTAWALTLSCYANDTDVVIGTTRSIRRSALSAADDSMVGLLINTVPMRVACDSNKTVRHVIQEVHAQKSQIRAHEHTPLFEIEKQTDIPRGQRLFETLLVFYKEGLKTSIERKSRSAPQMLHVTLSERPTIPLVLQVYDTKPMHLTVLVDTRRFDPGLVERLLNSLFLALASMAADCDQSIGNVSLINPMELVSLQGWNQTRRPFSSDLLIHNLFERQTVLRPNAVALESRDCILTYAELNRNADRVAKWLRANDLSDGKCIAVSMDHCTDLVVAALAVLKAGGIYLPLDPRYPVSRIAAMVRTTGAVAIIAQPSYVERLRFDGVTVVTLEGLDVGEVPFSESGNPGAPTDAACIFFTSGSTGTPNGVRLSHRAMVNTLEWVNGQFNVGPGDRLLPVTSICFDLSVYDMFGTLAAGATLVVATDDIVSDPELLATEIVVREVTIWNSAPAALSRLLPFLQSTSRRAMRLLLLSGDWMPITLPAAARSVWPRVSIANLGGATEAAIWSNWFPVEDVNPRWRSIPYGTPIQNCHYYVLNAALGPVPIGVAGALYIAGVCLADGYVNAPDITAARFITHPSSAERLYRTGDIARFLPDGTIELLGRADQQMKLRGFRVELTEVEGALASLPTVRAAVCMAHIDRFGDRFLVAYVVPAARGARDAAVLRDALSKILPSHAVPSQFVFLDELPVSTNGKVDRRALRRDGPESPQGFRAPRTSHEIAIAKIWERLLEFRPIGTEDDFFERGGHSLLAVRLLGELKSAFNVNIQLERLLDCRTVASLAAHVQMAQATRPSPLFLTFNVSGQLPPIVLLPEIRGTMFVYRDLPATFSADQPLLLAYPLETSARGQPPTVEDLAATYGEELIRTVPTGPIIVGGFSFGALVAFELAHWLSLQGRRVPLLISLDGAAPGYPRRLPLAPRLLGHIRHLSQTTGVDRQLYMLDRIASLRTLTYRALNIEHKLFPENSCAPQEVVQRNRRIHKLNRSALRGYDPAHRGRIPLLLLRADQSERWVGTEPERSDYGWQRFIEADIEVVVLPGRHLTILRAQNHGLIAQAISSKIASLSRT